MTTWSELNNDIVACQRCPRLINHCQKTAETKRRSFQDQQYWGLPVPNFGDPQAQLLIVGLAPAAHGANRTGRMFTGDRSGDWLYRALHKAGFANQKIATDNNDGLTLKNCAITAACHCAPPLNKPSNEELANCSDFLTQTVAMLPVQVFLALGQISWQALFNFARASSLYRGSKPKFSHGSEVRLDNDTWVIGSYHPSQQNTFTGKLTERMFDHVFSLCVEKLK